MNFTRFAFENKRFLWFILFIFVAGGFFAFQEMSKLEDPELVVKKALVITTYPGASAHKVELEVTDVLEKEIRAMGDLYAVTSRSLPNYSEIEVELKKQVLQKDLEQKWDMLRRKVTAAAASLPSGASSPIVKDDFGDVYGMFYAITSDGYSYEDLEDYTDFIKRELLTVNKVRRIDLYGKQAPVVNIELSKEKLANLGVHPLEVMMTLRGQNEVVYPGNLKSASHRIRLTVGDSFRSIKDIEELILQGHESDQVKLKDIATIEKGYRKPYSNKMKYNGQPSIGLAMAMESGGNILELSERVEKKLEELKTRIPAGIEIHKVFYQPEKVDIAISDFMVNLIESVAIVVLILMFAMGFRSSLIIGSGLVFTILGTFVVMLLIGGSLQRVSLASLIIAMGMLVDNAIVIMDGILIDFKRGLPKKDALYNTPRKTALPLLIATLIAVTAFLPIYLSPGSAAEYAGDLFIVLGISLLLSWVLALTQTPVFTDNYIKTDNNKDAEDPFAGKFYNFFRNILHLCIKRKFLTLGITALILFLAMSGGKYMKQSFFPDLTYNQAYLEYRMPAGTAIEKVEKDLDEIGSYILKKYEEITNITTSIGGTPARYNLVRSLASPSTHYGELILDFREPEDIDKIIVPLQAELSENYPQAYVRIKKYNLMFKKFPIEIMFSGPDPAILRSLSAKAEKIMREEETAVLVRNDWEPKTKLIEAAYSQPLARTSGLSRSDISMAMFASTEGVPMGTYSEGEDTMPLLLKSVDSKGNPIKDLKDIPVWAAIPSNLPIQKMLKEFTIKGQLNLMEMVNTIPLSQAVKGVNLKWEEPVIRRYDGRRSIKAQCNPATGYTAEKVRAKIKDKIAEIELPKGYSARWLGEYIASQEANELLFMKLPHAVIIMIALLIGLFKSYRKAMIIFVSIPLVMIGIIPGMIITGKEFGFMAIIGSLGLMGMMIKNAIVLIDEIDILLKQGKELLDAVVTAAVSRMRPVMMASLTTILGMSPLIFDSMFGGMAVTIMAGLLVGTLITLVFIPVFYYALFYRSLGTVKEQN